MEGVEILPCPWQGLKNMFKQLLPKKQKILWPDSTYYFLTSSTFLHYPYFREINQKQIVLNKIKEINQVLNISILDYSIAINHLHLKFFLEDGKLMRQLKIMLHSGISREYRKIYEVKYKEFWGSTRAYYIKTEKASWKVSGYIIGNLLKHREVSTFEELKENPFSSYRDFAEKFGEEATKDLVYSVIKVDEDAEGVVDLKGLKNIDSTLPMAGVLKKFYPSHGRG